MATVQCKCGEKYHPGPDHIGREIRCRKCGRTVTLVPDPSLEPEPPKRTHSVPFTSTMGATGGPQSFKVNMSAPPPSASTSEDGRPDMERPRGLHPEVRRILMYVALVALLLSGGLIFSVFKGGGSAPTQSNPAECC